MARPRPGRRQAAAGRRRRRAGRDDPRGGRAGPTRTGALVAGSRARARAGCAGGPSTAAGARPRAWGWVAHLRDGGTTPWAAGWTGRRPTTCAGRRLLPGAQQLELLRRLNLGRPPVARSWSSGCCGRARPAAAGRPRLLGGRRSPSGRRPVDPATCPPTSWSGWPPGCIAEDVVAAGLPPAASRRRARPWRTPLPAGRRPVAGRPAARPSWSRAAARRAAAAAVVVSSAPTWPDAGRRLDRRAASTAAAPLARLAARFWRRATSCRRASTWPPSPRLGRARRRRRRVARRARPRPAARLVGVRRLPCRPTSPPTPSTWPGGSPPCSGCWCTRTRRAALLPRDAAAAARRRRRARRRCVPAEHREWVPSGASGCADSCGALATLCVGDLDALLPRRPDPPAGAPDAAEHRGADAGDRPAAGSGRDPAEEVATDERAGAAARRHPQDRHVVPPGRAVPQPGKLLGARHPLPRRPLRRALPGRARPDAAAVGRAETEAVGAWDRLAAEVRAAPGTSIISHEILATASPLAGRAGRWIARLRRRHRGARRSSRCATWSGRSRPSGRRTSSTAAGSATRDFLERIRDPERATRIGTWFWGVQEIPDILDRWGHDLPPERVHLVTVPAARRAARAAVGAVQPRPSASTGSTSTSRPSAPTRRSACPRPRCCGGSTARANRALRPARLPAAGPRAARPPDAVAAHVGRRGWACRPTSPVGRRSWRSRGSRRSSGAATTSSATSPTWSARRRDGVRRPRPAVERQVAGAGRRRDQGAAARERPAAAARRRGCRRARTSRTARSSAPTCGRRTGCARRSSAGCSGAGRARGVLRVYRAARGRSSRSA